MLWDGFEIGPVSPSTPNKYVLSMPAAPNGLWRGTMGYFYFDGPAGTNTTYLLTTQVSVWPNTYPFPPCSGQGCMGDLV